MASGNAQNRQHRLGRMCGVWLAAAPLLLSACAGGGPLQLEPIPPPWGTVRKVEPRPVARPLFEWERLGTSVRGKPIQAAQFGTSPEAGPGSTPAGGHRRIYIIGGLRGDEPEAPLAAAELARQLATLGAPDGALVRLVRDVNPDGTARGMRTNTRGVDLSRNWPTTCFPEDERHATRHGRGPASEIEIAAVHRDMTAFQPDIVMVLGSSARGPRIAWLEGPASAHNQRMAFEFAAAARRIEPRWRASTEPGGIGGWPHVGSGSLPALVAREWGRAAVVIELQRGSSAQNNAQALLAGITRAVEPWPAAATLPHASGRLP
jgi:predicted deacylase